MANIREIALSILMEYDRDGLKKPSLLKDSLNKYDYLETRDKAFLKRLVDGCLERQIQLDYVLDSFSRTPVKKMQPLIRSLMRMSVYQIMFMDAVPDSAACNEAVKLANKHKFSGLKGFVNGVLRNISRNKENIKYPDKNADNGCEYLSVYYSAPKWLCRMWTNEYGFEKTRDILEFFLQPRPTTIRVNTNKIKVEKLKKELLDAGVKVTDNALLHYALDIEKTDNIRFLPEYDEGGFAIQDVSSMLVNEVADTKEGQIVIDVCASPGGKSLHAAERVGNNGKVISRDLSERKCELILENAERLGVENIEVSVNDARISDEKLRNKGDVLLLDVPCSGLGIMGRKSDIKLNLKKEALESLEELQWEIVKASWDYVREGGILLYSTCTVNKKENEDMVKRICTELPFEAVGFRALLPDRIKESELSKTADNGFIQLIPGEFGTDGFFIAKLRRKSE